ncbi:hypothetical protein NKH74_18570, partial [Mesorhizobium sp. M0933]
MALVSEDIASHPALRRHVQAQSRTLLQTYEANPRLASVFATQQRWLMAHIGLGLYFNREPDDHRKGLTSARFMDDICRHSVASRNTADAFLKEMLHYGFIVSAVPAAPFADGCKGRCSRPLRASTYDD